MSPEIILAAVLVAVAAVVGWVVGSRSGTAKAIKSRNSVEGGGESAGSERIAVFQDAVTRMEKFMRVNVEDPIIRGLDGDADALREGAELALAAVQDLSCYANDGIADCTARDLVDLVRQVNGEFRKNCNGQIRSRLGKDPISVLVDPEALMDSLYLILHNANRFGANKPIVVELVSEGAFGKIRVMDGGPGFTAEALSRAYDPFYSTTPDGLGLGLPHARRLVHLMGGEILIRNGTSGGGYVEISLPLA